MFYACSGALKFCTPTVQSNKPATLMFIKEIKSAMVNSRKFLSSR